MSYNYFSNNDFRNANPSCSIDDMEENFLHRLDVARYLSGVPFIINSAYRTEEHEKKQGRDGDSSHTQGVAVDIKCTNSVARQKIIDGLRGAGFNRIGIYKSFIHCDFDRRPHKDQNVTWYV